MSAYFSERANAFIDDHIVTPLLAKEFDEEANITKNYKYDPESNVTTTTLESSRISECTFPITLDTNFKKYDEAAPRSCCHLLKLSFMIILAMGNATAWVMTFIYSPFEMDDWNTVIVYIAGVVCLTTTLLVVMTELKLSSYPTSE